MRRLLWILPAVAIPAGLAAAQSAETNVVESAGDAFGITLGPESIGLYGPSSVRGFSPITAGNVRIDGLYFDLQGSMIDRLATDTRIRVGLAATGFPWPAPSGIVDYTLRQPKDTPSLTSITYTGPYDSRNMDLDGSTELIDGQLGIAAGGSYHSDEYNPGQTAHTVSWGILPKWQPNSNLSINTFWGRENTTGAKPQATIYVSPGQILPPISSHYYGPSWTNSDSDSEHYGVFIKGELSNSWSVRFGLFHSTLNLPRTYFDLYLNTTSHALGDHNLVVEPTQHYGSGSGEFQLSYKVTSGSWRHEILLGVRGRSMNARYGGAESLDFGVGPVAEPRFPRPTGYAFGPATSSRIHEHSAGLSYKLAWLERVNFTAALRRDTYATEVASPMLGSSNTSLQRWLYNFSAAFRPTHTFTLFGALTRGLEDSGIAPMNASNRGQVLPATRSSQEEVGAKFAPSASLSLLAGAFEIDKSYFALDDYGDYDNLGQERHRGLELSLTGEPSPGLRVVAGALFMTPEVLPRSAPGEVIGKRPIGQPHRMGQVCFQYRPLRSPDLSFDSVFSYSGSRVASVDNRTRIPGYAVLDLGARYQFNFWHHSATLRVQVLDVTNTLNWSIANDGGLSRWSGRRGWAYLVVDL